MESPQGPGLSGGTAHPHQTSRVHAQLFRGVGVCAGLLAAAIAPWSALTPIIHLSAC